MNALLLPLAALLALASAASSPKETAPLEPCTIRSPATGAFFDLNPLHVQDPETSKAKHPRHNSWNATGWDLPYNFTMNFCGGVIEDLEEKGGVVGVEKADYGNVSAYYEQSGSVYSIGQLNTQPVIRGRKLVLNYTDGSPCNSDSDNDNDKRAILDDDEDGEDDDEDDEDDDSNYNNKTSSKRPSKNSHRRKNTIVSLLCERDPLMPLLTLSFVATPDECTYFFEARSNAACAGVEQSKQTLSPGGVFGVIMLIAVAVYFVGGCVYSRMVLNQRGWRQLPNYALWAGIFGFFKDLLVILLSSCARMVSSRRGNAGYSRVNGGFGGAGSGRGRSGRDSEAENRLIDELNEEWDD